MATIWIFQLDILIIVITVEGFRNLSTVNKYDSMFALPLSGESPQARPVDQEAPRQMLVLLPGVRVCVLQQHGTGLSPAPGDVARTECHRCCLLRRRTLPWRGGSSGRGATSTRGFQEVGGLSTNT